MPNCFRTNCFRTKCFRPKCFRLKCRVVALLAALVLLPPAAASAETYPARSVTIVVP